MQTPPIREDGLQLDEQREFQKAFWLVERCAWVVFAALLLLVVVGLSGSGGYLSRAMASVATSNVEYPRVTRWQTSDEISVRFSAGDATHRLTLGPVFFEYFQVEGVQPQPERTLSTPRGTAMEFAAQDRAPVNVTIYVRALRPGFPQYSLALDGSPTDISTIILP